MKIYTSLNSNVKNGRISLLFSKYVYATTTTKGKPKIFSSFHLDFPIHVEIIMRELQFARSTVRAGARFSGGRNEITLWFSTGGDGLEKRSI